MEWIKDNLSWLFSGLGLTIFTVIGVMVRKMIATFGRNSFAMSKYNGYYEAFHLSTSVSGIVVRSCVTISSNRWGQAQVHVDSFSYKYEGKAEVVENNLYIFLKGENHNEYIQIIFNEPLTREFDVLVGVYSAVTENRIPVIGKMLLHKIGQPTNCERIRFDKADPRITTFLNRPENPIVVPKIDLPLFDVMPFEPKA